MRRRRLRLALLAVALIGVGVWLVWPNSSEFITAAKEKYARLKLGMPEADVASIMCSPPVMDRQLYGEWADDEYGSKWYRLTSLPDTRGPDPHERIYRWRIWGFHDVSLSGLSYQGFHVQVYCEQGRVVAISYVEEHDNSAKKWLRELPFLPTIVVPFLGSKVGDGRKAIPPS